MPMDWCHIQLLELVLCLDKTPLICAAVICVCLYSSFPPPPTDPRPREGGGLCGRRVRGFTSLGVNSLWCFLWLVKCKHLCEYFLDFGSGFALLGFVNDSECHLTGRTLCL